MSRTLVAIAMATSLALSSAWAEDHWQDINTYAPDLPYSVIGQTVDGIDDIRKAVRRDIKYGADWIKHRQIDGQQRHLVRAHTLRRGLDPGDGPPGRDIGQQFGKSPVGGEKTQ